jgi:hypothetical protein
MAESSLVATSLPKGSSVTARGAVSSGLRVSAKVKLAAVKQESTHGTLPMFRRTVDQHRPHDNCELAHVGVMIGEAD